jgi:hypothetical protein|tara:strand:- start:274 stop:600 length:327 start_codon:yes stop_codon:yes gene_type:complete
MDSFLNLAWTPFLAIFAWVVNRVITRLDALEHGKAENDAIHKITREYYDLEKRLDEINYKIVERKEIKADISLLHNRCNELANIKEDKIKDIRLVNSEIKNKEERTNR